MKMKMSTASTPSKASKPSIPESQPSQTVLSPLFQAALKDSTANITTNNLNLKEHSGAAKMKRPSFFTFTTGEMRVSQKKLNHLARLVRGMTLQDAQSQMNMSIKKRGKDVAAMFQRSASALVHNWGFRASSVRQDFIIKQAWVGKGVFLKRIRIHGRGRTGKMTRPRAHLKVILEEKKQDSPLDSQTTEIDPLTGQIYTADRIAAKKAEFDTLVKMFKRDRLFVTLKDAKPVFPGTSPWSGKGWKYITSPKWTDPSNARRATSASR